MCNERLNTLYRALITNRKEEIQQWHKEYAAFVGKVSKIREVPNDNVLTKNTHQDFLKRLLFQNNNGISSRGRSILYTKTFEAFIEDEKFLTALSEFITVSPPSKVNFEDFKGAWNTAREKANNEKNIKQPNTPLLVNRVAAACTLSVSSTVDGGKFNKVAGWLIAEGLIKDFPTDDDWFPKNQHVMKELKGKLEETDLIWISIFVWELYNYVVNPFSLKKQVIKYGAPGTGKTYMAKKETKILFELWKVEYDPKGPFTAESQIKLMQFHPSISYEDFMEGLRPSLGENGQTQLTLQNGVFKSFCIEAGKWEKDVSKLEGLNKSWEDLTADDLSEHKKQLPTGNNWEHILKDENKEKKVADCVPPFFFIIDEINRAELSRVLGELMYCLEYRGVEGAIDTQYASLNTEDTAMLKTKGGFQFFIPHNLYLIGTMNTIDRSIESFDFALRRRFRWEEVTPDMGILASHLRDRDEDKAKNKKWEDLAQNLEELNTAISKDPLLGADYQIGHAYLMNLKYSPSLTLNQVREQIWQDSLLPLLQEYLRGTGDEVKKIKDFKRAFGISS